jgi:transcriptional repressor NrdR
MVCPFCLHKKTNVYNSRKTAKLNTTWRRRRCEACGREFTTHETADPQSILRVGTSKKTIPYIRAKLTISILTVSDHRSDHGEAAYWLADTIEQTLYRLSSGTNNVVTKHQILNEVLEALKHFDTAAYVKYLSRYSPNLDARTLKRHLK